VEVWAALEGEVGKSLNSRTESGYSNPHSKKSCTSQPMGRTKNFSGRRPHG